MSDQMIFKRYKMKYLLNRTQYRQITEAFEGRMKPDIHGKNTICNQLSQAHQRRNVHAPCW